MIACMAESGDTQGVKYVGVRLSPELAKRFRIALAKEGKTAQYAIEGMVEAWVRKKEAEQG